MEACASLVHPPHARGWLGAHPTPLPIPSHNLTTLACHTAAPLQARRVDTELAPTWVTGILEVPIGLEHKLKSIEETEAAKKRMLAASGGCAPGGVGVGGQRRLGPGAPSAQWRTATTLFNRRREGASECTHGGGVFSDSGAQHA